MPTCMSSVMFSAHMTCCVKAISSMDTFYADGPVFTVIRQNLLWCVLPGM